MIALFIKTIAAIGLLLITAGVITKKETRRNIFFVLGGLGLLLYSIYIQDPIFIPLQIIFIIASVYELSRTHH